jgi:hypothetical protein
MAKNKPTQPGNAQKLRAERTHQASRTAVMRNVVYSGTIIECNPVNQTYTVRIEERGDQLTGCVWAANILSGMVGIRSHFIPPLGTAVLVVKAETPYILGCVPSEIPNIRHRSSRTATGISDGNKTAYGAFTEGSSKSPTSAGSFAPNDLLEGEFEMTNMLGVTLRMLTSIAQLSAGDKAKIEFHLLNDMVRLVSDCFQHISGFGEQHIFNDGRCNSETLGCVNPWELFGQKKGDPLLPVEANRINLDSIDKVDEHLRVRYAEYLGFLGDFVNTFVTDAVDALGKYSESRIGAGKARTHIGTDGTILMQSVSEIALERVARIVVPKRVKSHDDPTGVKPEDFDSLNTEFNKIWENGVDLANVPQTCYQLREYARYLNQFRSLSRFHQLKDKAGEFEIKSESQQETPRIPNTDVESGVDYYERYATIRIMVDGSIIILDAHGSSVIMSEGDVRLAAAKNLSLEAAGDVSIAAGQNIFLKARRSIELSSIVGAIRFKARSAIKVLCELGSIWLKADADSANPQTAAEGDPEIELESQGGIILDTTQSQVNIHAGDNLILRSTGSAEDRNKVIVQSERGDVAINAMTNIDTYSRAGCIRMSGQKILAAAPVFASNAYIFDISQKFTVAFGNVSASRLVCNAVTALQVIQGPDFPGPTPLADPPLHFNHVARLSGDEELLFAEDSVVQELKEYDPKIQEFEEATFEYVKPTEYQHIKKKGLYESYAQQYLRIDGPLDIEDDYGTWNWASDRVRSAVRTAAVSVWPGESTKWLRHSTTEKLNIASTSDPASFKPAFQQLDRANPVFKYYKP